MEDTFRTHCFIEFYYHLGKGFLNEHNSKLSFRKLNESYGVFNGCRTIAEQITEKVINTPCGENECKIVNMMLNNSWINMVEIAIYCDNNTITTAGYDPQKSFITKCGNGKEKVSKFYPLKLVVNASKIAGNSTKLTVALMHELTHAYEDYNRRQNGNGSIGDEARRLGYYKNNVLSYDGDYENYISAMLYYITGFERNAFMAQFKGELDVCDKHFNSIGEIIDFLKNTQIYNNYDVVSSYIDFFSTEIEEEVQPFVLEFVEKISNLKFSTYNRFVKYLQKKKYEIERKMNTIIPKIAYEKLSFGNELNSFDSELPKIKK